jgi:hypothetical protein
MKPRKRGDTGYAITATLKANGTVVDLTGSTVTIWLRNRATQALKVSGGVCTIASPTTGQVSYQPSSTDVDTSGMYDVEFKQVQPDTTVIHYPSDGYEPLTIEDSLG